MNIKTNQNSACCQCFFSPEINRTVILFIDMQDKFIPVMPDDIQNTIARQKILLQGAKLLQVPVVVTEQYPQGLGQTIPEITEILDTAWPIYEKSTFSSLGPSEVRMELEKKSINTVVIVGIEAHVCVLQSALDSLGKGLQTIILKDAVNSRKSIDKETGLETAKSAGVHFMTVESLLFMLMQDSKHPAFREISKLLR